MPAGLEIVEYPAACKKCDLCHKILRRADQHGFSLESKSITADVLSRNPPGVV